MSGRLSKYVPGKLVTGPPLVQVKWFVAVDMVTGKKYPVKNVQLRACTTRKRKAFA